jgi:hypothetical protein
MSRYYCGIYLPFFLGERGGTSYIAPVKRGNEKISSFVKTAGYKTVSILGTLLP